jgi:hypothetical protein
MWASSSYPDSTKHPRLEVTICGNAFTTQSVNDTVAEGTNAVYTVVTTMPSPIYQWQEDPGTGFVNLVNVWPYSGVGTNTLTIHNASIHLNTTHYRCYITNGSPCTDTSASAILIVQTNTGIKQSAANLLSIYPNPAHDQVSICLPSSDGTAILMSQLGQIVAQQTTASGTMHFDLTNLPAGMYFIKINGTEVRRFVKE